MTFKKLKFKLESKTHQPLKEIHEKHTFLLIHFKVDCLTIHFSASYEH